ncbi:MAG: hypothetical protein ACLFQX_04380 [Candidatus Kapaibacterium sp.]
MAANNKGLRYFGIAIFAAFVISGAAIVIYLIANAISGDKASGNPTAPAPAGPDTAFMKAVMPSVDTAVRLIRVSDIDAIIGTDENAGRNIRRVFNGRRINIAIIGVDSRLGQRYKHADANHVLSILIDSAKIEITAIPRDTPADAGLPDTSDQNKLTIVRAAKGREAYLAEVARIAELDRIHYYVEVGFSQAMGILEWLGFRESGSALQVLRSRRGLGGDDFQRSYNQAQFIRQAILGHFDKFTGIMGEVFIRGGLALVDTDLSVDRVRSIVYNLGQRGFPRSPEDIYIRVRPPMPIKFKVYDFSNPEVVASLSNKIEGFNKKDTSHNFSSGRENPAAGILYRRIAEAERDTARPLQVINRLSTLFDQKAWLQVQDHDKRRDIRNKLSNLLINAYIRKGWANRADEIRTKIELENQLFDHAVNPVPDSIKNHDKTISRQ